MLYELEDVKDNDSLGMLEYVSYENFLCTLLELLAITNSYILYCKHLPIKSFVSFLFQ